MTIPNRITLEDLPTMPVGEITVLPGDQLALLKQDADERLRAAKKLSDWLDGAIALTVRQLKDRIGLAVQVDAMRLTG